MSFIMSINICGHCISVRRTMFLSSEEPVKLCAVLCTFNGMKHIISNGVVSLVD